MLTITLDPIIAHIGPLVLRWYSLILIMAIGVGVLARTHTPLIYVPLREHMEGESQWPRHSQ